MVACKVIHSLKRTFSHLSGSFCLTLLLAGDVCIWWIAHQIQFQIPYLRRLPADDIKIELLNEDEEQFWTQKWVKMYIIVQTKGKGQSLNQFNISLICYITLNIVNKSTVESNGFLFEPVHRRSLSNLHGSADLRKNWSVFSTRWSDPRGGWAENWRCETFSDLPSHSSQSTWTAP